MRWNVAVAEGAANRNAVVTSNVSDAMVAATFLSNWPSSTNPLPNIVKGAEGRCKGLARVAVGCGG
jgi:hypothetical protein